MTEQPTEVEYPQGSLVSAAPPTDHKGRTEPEHMSERDLLVELVANIRVLADTVEELADTPMFKAMQGGSNPLMAMFGR